MEEQDDDGGSGRGHRGAEVHVQDRADADARVHGIRYLHVAPDNLLHQ